VIAVSVTGVLLNHRESLSLWNPPRGEETPADEALPINTLLRTALDTADGAGVPLRQGPGPRNINRMMYRPGRGTVAVRLNDPRSTEVVLDARSGAVLQIAPRDDVSLEHVHSGEVVGQKGVILSDVVGGAIIVLTVGGAILWLRRLRGGRRAAGSVRSTRWYRVNVFGHTAAGLAVAVILLVLSVTGILLNHKRELELMIEPIRVLEAEDVVKAEPVPLARIIDWARAGAPRRQRSTDVRWVDYRPLAGYAKVRFDEPGELEVIVDVYEPRVLSAARRFDVLVEQIHSGAVLGARFTLLSDVAGIVLIILTVNGLYVWIAPAWTARGRVVEAAADASESEPGDAAR